MQIEEQIESMKAKHEALYFTVVGHTHRLERVEQDAIKTNAEIIFGREKIMDELELLSSQISELDGERLMALGRTQELNRSNRVRGWIIGTMINFGILIATCVTIYVTSGSPT